MVELICLAEGIAVAKGRQVSREPTVRSLPGPQSTTALRAHSMSAQGPQHSSREILTESLLSKMGTGVKVGQSLE
jgi:hypothetical protein